MQERYDPKAIEQKWQDAWAEAGIHTTRDDSGKEKRFILIEFPYPSGVGLHIGHTRPYTAMDTLARKRRMQGFEVLFPMGWDAFGLPTENFAIQNKLHPADVTRALVAKFTAQSNALGYSFDWKREVNSTDPSYYKWTQWIFLKLFEHGLAYKAKMPVNWCVSCRCVLANEEVAEGECERCHGEVERREKEQWMLKITAYAQKLLDGLEGVDYPERVKASQRHWIGRSEGAGIRFGVTTGDSIEVFTTRPDTVFGATYMVLSPEHALVEKWMPSLKNNADVKAYRLAAAKKSDRERTDERGDKTGVRLEGVNAVNPATGAEVPIFISDYVLSTYGTGAIMAVPGHDTRDWDFARKFNLPIIEVVSGGDVEREAYTDCEQGILVNSGLLNGLDVAAAKAKIIRWLEENKLGEGRVNYKLRDWVFARQRYWGEPVPIVHCPACGMVPLPEHELPLCLPNVESYQTTDTGESPLSLIREWVEVPCPKCGAPSQRETDTMPQWAGSSWYFLRYTDPKNPDRIADPEKMKLWMPVGWYNGGMEHATLHMLYSRFWHKFLYDIGEVPCPEPYAKRTSHGDILGPDGEKMSKSRGNIIDPSDVIAQYGADTMRLYIMFIGDFEKAAAWMPEAVKGCRRFLDRVWLMCAAAKPGGITAKHNRLIHQTIKKVSEDTEVLKFNTAIAAMMTLVNELSDAATVEECKKLLTMLSPFAPHMCEELWAELGGAGFACQQPWPEYDPACLVEDTVEMAVQIYGKFVGTITLPADAPDQDAIAAALADARVAKRLPDLGELKRGIVVKNKIVNLVFS
jgi:leucyl-tRNA synthetase